jgi:hypothetical protein
VHQGCLEALTHEPWPLTGTFHVSVAMRIDARRGGGPPWIGTDAEAIVCEQPGGIVTPDHPLPTGTSDDPLLLIGLLHPRGHVWQEL